MEERKIDSEHHRTPRPRSAPTADGFFQRSGFYMMAAALLLVLGATLVAATQVGASGWFGNDHEESRHERIRSRVGFVTDLVLGRIDATEAQSIAVQEIVADSLERFHTMHEANADFDARLAALWTAQTVEPDAVEAFRFERMQRFEVASQQLTEALIAIAAELTQEQRVELVELVERHRGQGRHGRGAFHH